MSAIISNAIVISGAQTQPANHARIGYKSILNTANSISVSSAATNFPASALQNPATYERWKPTALPATVTVDAGDAVTCDYAAIAAHTLRDNNCSVTVSYSYNNSTFTDLKSISPANNGAIMLIFTPTLARYWRITINGSSVPTVGVLYIGKTLEMQRALYAGHSPIVLSRVTAVRPNISERGQWLGSTIERQGLKAQFEWRHLTADWYRKHFDKFAASNPRANPFFIAWRPEKYPNEVGYCWATSDIQPVNMGVRDYLSVSLDVEGYAGG